MGVKMSRDRKICRVLLAANLGWAPINWFFGAVPWLSIGNIFAALMLMLAIKNLAKIGD